MRDRNKRGIEPEREGSISRQKVFICRDWWLARIRGRGPKQEKLTFD